MSRYHHPIAARTFAAALAAVMLVALSAHPAKAQPYWQIYEQDTIPELRPLAEQGDAGAQFQIGTKYLAGRWIRKDTAEGLRWLRASAEQGFTKAQLHLGTYYADAENDDPAALAWFRRAAENASERDGAIAARKAGVILSSDAGTSSEAVRYFRRAAERSDPQAQVLLGTMYLDGRGVTKSSADGLKWIEQAATANYVLAKHVLTFVHAEGVGTAPNILAAASPPSGSRTATNQADAFYFIGTFYHRGFRIDREGKPILSWVLARTGFDDESIRRYFNGQRVSADYQWADWTRALAWYRKGAEAGHIGAQVNLGLIHFDFRGGNWDCAEGMRWMRQAADRGDPTAQLNLGSFFLQGPDRSAVRIGATSINIPEGVRIESVDASGAGARAGLRTGDRIISANGKPLATFGREDLAAIVESSAGRKVALLVKREGEDTAQSIDVVPEKIALKCPGAEAAGLRADPAEAFRWFERAADGGHLSGLFFLAGAYREGKGTPQNPLKAMELYRKGAERGDWQAAQAISHMYAAGEGVETSKELSEEWFRKALQLKHRSLGRN